MINFKTHKSLDKVLKKLSKSDSSLFYKVLAALDDIRCNPLVGCLKKGDLLGVRCKDIYHSGTNYEMAYILEENNDGEIEIIIFLLVGSHENFYNELKRLI
ncbi:type II toxin-antitoxin system RelE/ParE family toxin [Lysinibacillus xylanilyticus]|uniref:Plasmid stabilization protein n=1 Tax=Lysinibacillus xylanilyticus TaxID=582475 RepID=A0A2M9Q619_9BACI|nr:type II toxin-antitoxin system RelE/ParE family toxin [Lysinibacillus xylanilyticus]PJO43422.1 plasmid stabilization protein [Lysinibacillus xylanilyticus]